MEKIYSVEFLNYCSYTKSTVSNNDDDISTRYIDTKPEPFLIRESEIEYWKSFGGGFKTLTYVGVLRESEEE